VKSGISSVRLGALLAIILTVAGLTAIGLGTAAAQYAPRQGTPYPGSQLPPPDDDDDDSDGPVSAYPGPMQPGQPPAYESRALPPPGYPAAQGQGSNQGSYQGAYIAPSRDGIPRPPGEVTNSVSMPPFIGGNQQQLPQQQTTLASLPPEDQPEIGEAKPLPPNLQRQIVDYPTKEPPGTIIIDTQNTYLYLVLEYGKAMRYGVGVGREGFTWAGAERISRVAEWPDWHPPKEMIERQPYLPRFMAGGPTNPLGARALYLGKTVYRIHGTNQPSTIGTFVSSGCIRLVNSDIEDLYTRVNVGTKVVVLPGGAPKTVLNMPVPNGPGSISPDAPRAR
jgi:lipoprotein-anchoring transpeptidase ErfK/SrfK